MKLNMDTIQFEHRGEIENIMKVLEEWLQQHPTDPKTEDVQILLGKLDTMHMSW